MSNPIDPDDPNQKNTDLKISLFWILLPVGLVFVGIIGMTLYHLQHQDYLRP